MEKFRPFQVALLVGFGLMGILSLVILASVRGISGNLTNPYGDRVEVWGTFDEAVMLEIIQTISDDDKNFKVVDYIEKDPRTFGDELVNAIAEGSSPDAVFINSEELVTYRSKLQPISYENISKRMIRDTYIDGAEIFALSDGLYALPIAVDPMVMYWNRGILASGGEPVPPATWESLTDMVQNLTLRDATRNILQSTVAFGEYKNVIYAKETLLTLLMQSGSRMIEETDRGYVVAIDTLVGDSSRTPLAATLQFFVEFSNVNSPLYSWNRSQENDLTAFLGEELALYFGYGSEAPRIESSNPNFNFDVVGVPQGAGATIKRVYGKFYGLSLLKASDNPQGTYLAMLKLNSPEVVSYLTNQLYLSPVLRTLVAEDPGNPYRQTIFNQALISYGWLDPDSEKSDEVFNQMIDDIVSNRQKISSVAADTVRRLELSY